ncbi:MAG: universal stress protein, partial [Thermoplasmata archaeon]|nr:universal stress protein [Thermoplasmata archaeon]
MPAFARITVAVDGSPHSGRALDAAIELAKPFHSTVTLISVVPLYVNYAPAAVPPASYYEE